jgi:hypothetical protein
MLGVVLEMRSIEKYVVITLNIKKPSLSFSVFSSLILEMHENCYLNMRTLTLTAMSTVF